ncbi:unnamed protein product, partial [Rotaria sp. Silwood2]
MMHIVSTYKRWITWEPSLIRYGLNVDKFGSSGSKWLACDGAVDEWAVGFHGVRRDVLQAMKSIAFDGLK